MFPPAYFDNARGEMTPNCAFGMFSRKGVSSVFTIAPRKWFRPTCTSAFPLDYFCSHAEDMTRNCVLCRPVVALDFCNVATVRHTSSPRGFLQLKIPSSIRAITPRKWSGTTCTSAFPLEYVYNHADDMTPNCALLRPIVARPP